jgi:hypothetical protein
MTLIGMASTMINLTLYPSINYLIKEKYFGTAYGIIESLSNVGLFIGPLVIGDILNTDIINETENQNIEQYHTVHILLFILALIALIISICLNLYDKSKRGKNVLNTVITFDEERLSSGYCSTESEIDVEQLINN